MKTNHCRENLRQKGSIYEERAAAYLESLGYQILERNYYARMGEVDLICRERVDRFGQSVSYLVFVEVKYRSNKRYGSALEAVGSKKRHRIVTLAQVYMKHHEISFQQPVRFDVLGIDGDQFTLIRNAWGGM